MALPSASKVSDLATFRSILIMVDVALTSTAGLKVMLIALLKAGCSFTKAPALFTNVTSGLLTVMEALL